MPWARFLYGVTVGLLMGWVGLGRMDLFASSWLLVGAAVTLTLALLLHQHEARERRGRRWRKTID